MKMIITVTVFFGFGDFLQTDQEAPWIQCSLTLDAHHTQIA